MQKDEKSLNDKIKETIYENLKKKLYLIINNPILK